MATCTLCEQDVERLRDGVCKACRDRHGLLRRTDPLRPKVPCRQCGGLSFVRGLTLRERAAEGGDHTGHFHTPLAISYGMDVQTTLFRGRKVKTPDPRRPRGVLESYTCRSCGLVELYARDAELIPIGLEYGTELFEVGGSSGYR